MCGIAGLINFENIRIKFLFLDAQQGCGVALCILLQFFLQLDILFLLK